MAGKIKETISFLTQIHTSWEGVEQRMALRNTPRRFMSYDYIGVRSWHSQWLRMLAFGQQTQQFFFPLWHANSLSQDEIFAGQTVLKISQDVLWGFRDVGYAMAWMDDERGGEKFTLKYITASGILGLKEEMQTEWKSGAASIVPVCNGVLQQEDNYENIHDELTTMTINVELMRNQGAPVFPEAFNEHHDEAAPFVRIERGIPKQYNGVEVFSHEPPWASNIDASFSRNANRLDNITGVFRYDLKSTETTESKKIEYTGISRAEVNNLQRFFYRCRGQLKSFFAPTWVNDLELVDDAPVGQIFFLVKFSMYWNYYSISRRRRLAMVFFNDQTTTILKVAGYSEDDLGKHGKVYLDKPLEKPLNKNHVRMISYLCRQRFAGDDLVTDYDTTNIATVAFNLKEVDE